MNSFEKNKQTADERRESSFHCINQYKNEIRQDLNKLKDNELKNNSYEKDLIYWKEELDRLKGKIKQISHINTHEHLTPLKTSSLTGINGEYIHLYSEFLLEKKNFLLF